MKFKPDGTAVKDVYDHLSDCQKECAASEARIAALEQAGRELVGALAGYGSRGSVSKKRDALAALLSVTKPDSKTETDEEQEARVNGVNHWERQDPNWHP